MTVPSLWSNNRAKLRRYVQEPYFQESYIEYIEIANDAAYKLIENKSYILFKPDAAPARCVEQTLSVLAEYGIRAVYATLFKFNRWSWRELWRYELNISTYERYPAIDALLTAGPSLFVILEVSTGELSQSLSVFVNSLKGPSLEADRSLHHLRFRIRARNGVLNHVHCPEDPLDVIREVGVLFDHADRAAILTALSTPRCAKADIIPMITEFYSSAPEHALSVDVIKTRLVPERLTTTEFDAFLSAAAEEIDFNAFLKTLRALDKTSSWWDAMTLFVAKRPFVVPDVVPVLDYEDRTGGHFW